MQAGNYFFAADRPKIALGIFGALNWLTPDDLIGSKSDFGAGLGGLPLEPAITGAEKATAVAVMVKAIKSLFMENAPV